MKLLEVNSKVALIGVILMIIGIAVLMIAFSSMNFNIDTLLNHSTSWYSPITWS